MSIQPLSHFKGTFKIIFRFDPAIIFLLNFFDEYLGLGLDVIPAFTANEWQYWLDILCRMEIMMARLGKHHYRDAILLYEYRDLFIDMAVRNNRSELAIANRHQER